MKSALTHVMAAVAMIGLVGCAKEPHLTQSGVVSAVRAGAEAIGYLDSFTGAIRSIGQGQPTLYRRPLIPIPINPFRNFSFENLRRATWSDFFWLALIGVPSVLINLWLLRRGDLGCHYFDFSKVNAFEEQRHTGGGMYVVDSAGNIRYMEPKEYYDFRFGPRRKS